MRGKVVRTTFSDAMASCLLDRINWQFRPSISSTGDSYDNALAESLNGLYKAELSHRRTPSKTEASSPRCRECLGSTRHSLLESIGHIRRPGPGKYHR